MSVPVTEFNDVEYLQKVVIHLYGILDDIDTADDIARDNDTNYREIVRKLQAEKNESGISPPDGYSLSVSKRDFTARGL